MVHNSPIPADHPESGVAFSVHPIGLVRATPPKGPEVAAPSQAIGSWTVEIFPRFGRGLGHLEAGSLAWLVTYQIDHGRPDEPLADRAGTSGCPSPTDRPDHRFSPIRFTRVKLTRTRGNRLYVEGAAIENGTPVLDFFLLPSSPPEFCTPSAFLG